MKKLLTTLLGLTMVVCANAQSAVNGKVVDQKTGEPLIGATIIEVNTQNGAVTDESGLFELEVANTDAKITISYVGYVSRMIDFEANFITIDLKLNDNLEEVIIESVRAEGEPITYSNVSRSEIEKVYNGEQPIFLLEELTPSIFSYSESGTRIANGGNLRLRGIGQERINMTLNGIPLNDMIDHGVFFSNFTDIGNSIESVQVQRGVGTSTNGVSSYAGSINFESINLYDRAAGGTLEMGLGSFGTRRFNASGSTGMINEKWSAYTSFSRLYSDGFRDGTFTDAYSFFLSVGYFGEKDFFKINVFDANAKNGLGYSPVLLSDLRLDPKTNYLNENDQDDFGQQLVQFQHTHQFSNQTSLVSSLYYGAAGGDFLFTDTFSDPAVSINFPLQNRHYGIMSNFFWTPSDRFEMTSGIHAYLFDRENDESLGPDFENPYYQERSDKSELSAFSKAKLSLEKLSFYGDLQFRTMELTIRPDYDFIGTADEGNIVKSWTFINPKIGVNYQATANVEGYASLGRTGREPTKLDILGGFQLNASNLALARSDAFKPEYVNDLELGIRYSSDRLKFNANYFFMQFENEIAPYGELIAFGVQRRINIDRSTRSGIELEGVVSVFDWMQASMNLTVMRSNIEEINDESSGETYQNVSSILSPDIIYNFAVDITPTDQLNFSLSGRGISKSYLEISNDESLTMPAYFVGDFRVGYQLKAFSVSVEVNNIFDTTYFSNGAPVDVDFDGTIDGPGFNANAGRNYFLTTRINF